MKACFGDEVNSTTERIRQAILQRDETEIARGLIELDREVYVALGSGLPARHRPEEGDCRTERIAAQLGL